ncbi:MAG: hypothetical protein ACOY3P_26300 [Planctomycetota bacterium]
MLEQYALTINTTPSNPKTFNPPEPGGQPGGWLNPLNLLRGLYTGDPNASDEVYVAAREGAAQSVEENIGCAQNAIDVVDVFDPTPISGTLGAVMSYAQAKDEEAAWRLKLAAMGPAGDALKLGAKAPKIKTY